MVGFESVGVIGGGVMGAGIAEVLARSGRSVTVVEVSEPARARAERRIAASLGRAAERGKLSEAEVDATVARVSCVTGLRSVAECDLVIEAASEDESTKLALFRELGALLVKEEALIVSNTSSIPIVKLGVASGRPSQVMGVHFFNPAPVMRLVELIPSLMTSEQTLTRMRALVAEGLGKEPVEATDRAGFVVNSLLVPYLLSAIRMYEAGYASASDIDRSMVLGCGYPMGPLALADLIGLDTIRAIGISLYDEFKEPLYAPPPLLERMVDAGLLGAKSGQGFHPYEEV
ncbi:3-hydroxybutyryl-CoA dehydrogenase [Nocardioides aquiterrae]|uniref:3-hydroxybutyryl-CoA dehydrogenase n=1 Tax=Nocardioides aquiterrae TaxID=203799 RepID=A0ABN1UC17_9ACTN